MSGYRNAGKLIRRHNSAVLLLWPAIVMLGSKSVHPGSRSKDSRQLTGIVGVVGNGGGGFFFACEGLGGMFDQYSPPAHSFFKWRLARAH